MIEALLGLTFNLQAQKGTYAVLLGSGVSRAASIPTGWEVTLDLVRKLAHLKKQNCEPNPASWYLTTFGKEPDYSSLLDALAPGSAAQQQLLRPYFEASAQERDEGKKRPTRAHRAIARLVRLGYVKVIITTNFDRLLEAALEQEGIAPLVIASPDSANGAPPLAHTQCTVFKIHGDYLDSRIKNSPDALAKYDKRENKLLDQILDEYGLIIAGWSADYDTALRAAFERARSRRYPMYWAQVGVVSKAAQAIINLHRATVIETNGADSFFGEIVDNVEALEQFSRPHPLSKQTAVAALKNYMAEPRHRIRLRDLIVDEATRSAENVKGAWNALAGAAPSRETIPAQMKRLESACETLCGMVSAASFFGPSEYTSAPFVEAQRILLATGKDIGGYEVWTHLKRYPVLLLIYSAGIPAVASSNFRLLADLALSAAIPVINESKLSTPVQRINVHTVLDRGVANRNMFDKDQNFKTPFSDYLLPLLREWLSPLSLDDDGVQRDFDRFEFLWALLYADATDSEWAPFGSYIWRSWSPIHERFAYQFNCAQEIHEVVDQKQIKWPPLAAGLFQGKLDRLAKVFATTQEYHLRLSRQFI